MANTGKYASRPSPRVEGLGPLIRMYPIHTAELPAHPDLPAAADESSRPEIVSFFTDVLNEGLHFATSFIPTFEKKGGLRDANPSTGKVQCYARDVDIVLPPTPSGGAGRLSTESWFARVSQHENAVKDGTASFDELDAGLRKDHAVNEQSYTPDLEDAHLVLDYSSQLASHQASFGQWKEIQVELREMIHHLPPPLNKRCFTVMVVSGRRETDFLDVQLPINFREVPNAKYTKAGNVTEGIYVSVEYGSLIENGAKTEWKMATSSDAKGVLPLYVQKMAMPGAIVKDVSLFMKWRMEQRKK